MDRFGYTLGWGEEIREKLLNVGIRACMEERSRHLGEDTRKGYEENKEEVKASFYKAVDAVGRQVKELQEAGVKSAICYIHISYLLSGVLTGEHKTRIDFYDRRHFADLREAGGFWDYSMLFPEYKRELEEMEYRLRREVPRLTFCEVQRAKTYFQVGNFIVLEPILKELVREKRVRECLDGYLAETVNVYYGAYLDQAELICKWER